LTASDEDYPRQRAALAHGFSERAINGQEANLTQHIKRFVEKLEERAKENQAIDMTMWLQSLNFDVIGEFALSMQFGCIENSQNHPWVALIVRWVRAVSFAANATAFGLLTPFIMLFANIKDLRGFNSHLERSAAKVRERLEIGDDSSKLDLWSYVLSNEGDKSLTPAEMEVNAATLLVAATGPVSDTLCGAVYLLAKNRDALNSLRDELESHIKSDDDITMSATARMPYLHGAINESLRCYTPTPVGARRQTPPGGASISGNFVPEGVSEPLYPSSH